MYKSIIRPFLFKKDAEDAHYFVFNQIQFWSKIPGVRAIMRLLYKYKNPRLAKNLMGLTFPNPVGLAAGFDKDAKLYKQLGDMGFGFVEIGTLTPKGQAGNDKPRLFRLIEDEAIINRMGFNNEGVEDAVERLKSREKGLIVGGNIGKNKITPNEQANEDYVKSFQALFPHVDYFVVNVSSPNTPNLRELQDKEPLERLLQELMDLNVRMGKKPLLLKIAPDVSLGQLDDIIDIIQTTQIDGVIATNTTIDRGGLISIREKVESIGAGGLSGKPVKNKSTEVIRYLKDNQKNPFVIIGVGGIFTGADALEKLNAGADLIQVYSGYIYEGPAMIKNINKYLAKHL
ncbi:MAG: dihydroorotate dehydrogenase [Luteibaculaceae bacterium]|jgi:dihydroorotate dehydrogenase